MRLRYARRAQLSVELFLALTMFLLVLYWLNYFVAASNPSRLSLVSQEKLLARSLTAAADVVCATNSSTTILLPCLYVDSKKIPYSIHAAVNSSVLTIFAEADVFPGESNALCNFTGFAIQANCLENNAGTACINATNGLIELRRGECD